MSTNRSRSSKDMVLEEFIELYRSEPCLWQVKNKNYHDRNKREAAYAKLASKLREIEPDAARETVVKRINNLRSAVRKEKKKVDASKKSGTSTDAIYKPALWYYDLLSFLGDQDIPASSTSNLDHEENASGEDDFQQAPAQHDESTRPPTPGRPTEDEPPPIPQARPKRKKTEDLTTDVLISVRDHFKKPTEVQEDRYDLFAKTVAAKLRSLEKRQSLIAEKIINDVLFEAEMGTLAYPPHGPPSGSSPGLSPAAGSPSTSPYNTMSYGNPNCRRQPEMCPSQYMAPHQSAIQPVIGPTNDDGEITSAADYLCAFSDN